MVMNKMVNHFVFFLFQFIVKIYLIPIEFMLFQVI